MTGSSISIFSAQFNIVGWLHEQNFRGTGLLYLTMFWKEKQPINLKPKRRYFYGMCKYRSYNN